MDAAPLPRLPTIIWVAPAGSGCRVERMRQINILARTTEGKGWSSRDAIRCFSHKLLIRISLVHSYVPRRNSGPML